MNIREAQSFCETLGIDIPVIGGPMYPCSNPELVAAVSESGGIGVIQPLSLVYVNKYEFRAGIRKIRSLTNKPIGLNALVEKSNKKYELALQNWVSIALEEGVRFFVTSLGNPRWVVRAASEVGGIVFHDATESRFAKKALDEGVHGLICVNNRAGGHLGSRSPESLFEELAPLGVPLIAAGGVGSAEGFLRMLKLGYVGVQMGTRFIATPECKAHDDYKNAILKASSRNIVASNKITGVPVSVIENDYVKAIGTEANPLIRFLLKHNKFKHYVRSFYSLKSVWKLKRDERRAGGYDVYWQAGKSVDEIMSIEPVDAIMKTFRNAYSAELNG